MSLAKAFDKARRSGRIDLRIIRLRRSITSSALGAAKQHSTQEDARKVYNKSVYKMRLTSKRYEGIKGDLSRNGNELELLILLGRLVVLDVKMAQNFVHFHVDLHETRSGRLYKRTDS